MTQNVGEIEYVIKADTKDLLRAQREAEQSLESISTSANKADKTIGGLTATASQVSSALRMPEVNKLSNKLAQLSGNIGAASEAASGGAKANNRFSGALSTVAGAMGAGYVSNVGSATSALIKYTKEALNATSAQLDNALAAKQEALALQGAAAQLAINAAAEKNNAESAAAAAQSELKAAEAIFARKEADIASLEALLSRQKEALRQSEANLKITSSEKAVAQAVRDRNAVEATQAKILKQSNLAVKEVIAAEDKAKAAKVAVVAAGEKVAAAAALESRALDLVSKSNEAVAISSAKVTTAARAQTLAMAGLRGGLSLLGGPAGLLLLAAAGVYSLYQAMNDTSAIDKYKQEIDEAIKRIQYLTKVQADAAAGKARIQLDVDTKDLKEASNELAELKNQLYTATQFKASPKALEELSAKVSVTGGKVSDLSEAVRVGQERIAQFEQQAAKAGETSAATASALEIYDKAASNLTESNNNLEASINGTLSAAEKSQAIKKLEEELAAAGVSADDAATQVAKLKAELERKQSLTFESELKAIEDNVATLRVEMEKGKGAAIEYRAALDASAKGWSPEQTKAIINAKREEYNLNTKIAQQNKPGRKGGAGSKGVDAATQALTRQQAALDRLNTGYADGSLELAKYDAVMALGSKATAQQVAQAEQQAEAIWKVQQATKQVAEEEKKRAQAQQANKAAQQLIAETQATSYNGGLAQDALAAINLQEQQRLEVYRKYREQNLIDQQTYEDTMTAIAYDAAQKRIEALRNQNDAISSSWSELAGSASELAGSLAGAFESSTGKMGSAYAAMFALSKGFAVAQASIGMYTAASQAMTLPFPENLAAAAKALSFGSQIVSAVSGINYSGARYNGGPVSGNSMYRVGEKGKPEIFQASNGNQYMIPGDNGRVISNRDMQSGGGGGGAIQQHNYFTIQSANGDPQELARQIAEISYRQAIKAIIEQKRGKGLLDRNR